MTTTREEQRDVERDVLSTLAEWRETIRAWSGSAFVAGEDVGDTAGAREQLYLDLCRIGNETVWMEDEITRLRAQPDAGEAERAEYERDLRKSQQQCQHLQRELEAAKRDIARLAMARARGADEQVSNFEDDLRLIEQLIDEA